MKTDFLELGTEYPLWGSRSHISAEPGCPTVTHFRHRADVHAGRGP